MDQRHLLSHLSPAQEAALMEAAKRRALQLRGEAMDAFWSRVIRGLQSAWHAVRHDAHPSHTARSSEARPCPR